jgi:hypothetical protein
MGLIDNKQAITDRADADSRARERSKAMSEALRTAHENGSPDTQRQRARQEAAGIPTNARIIGVNPEVQAERDERAAAHQAEAPSMSDIIRGSRRNNPRGKTTNEILDEQTRGKRR